MEKIFISGASILAVVAVGSLFFFNQIKFTLHQPFHLIKKISLEEKKRIDPLPPIASSTPEKDLVSTSTELIDLVPPTSNKQTPGAVRVPIFVYHSVAPFYS